MAICASFLIMLMLPGQQRVSQLSKEKQKRCTWFLLCFSTLAVICERQQLKKNMLIPAKLGTRILLPPGV